MYASEGESLCKCNFTLCDVTYHGNSILFQTGTVSWSGHGGNCLLVYESELCYSKHFMNTTLYYISDRSDCAVDKYGVVLSAANVIF